MRGMRQVVTFPAFFLTRELCSAELPGLPEAAGLRALCVAGHG